ncbi:MAG: class I SAM-dependent methyltransferase [Cyanobacteria bacterium]|nr:class I SAM-dependent methyltransferase [Cyanobacteria bacterium bin.275]
MTNKLLLRKNFSTENILTSWRSRPGINTIRRIRNLIKALSRRLRAPLDRRYALLRLNTYHSKPRTLDEVIDWAMNFGGGGYFTIKTMQIPFEISTLARRVCNLKPKIILEIGTMRGGTLLIWTQLASERVISCDLRDYSICKVNRLLISLPPPTSECKVDLLSGDSHTPAFKNKVAQTLRGQKVDFLFIDGDHSSSGVKQDYLDYKEFVRPGGLIAFHDIVEKQPIPGNEVYQFWITLKEKEKTEEIVQSPEQVGFGIGIVEVPQPLP